jgi:hypothetical protein
MSSIVPTAPMGRSASVGGRTRVTRRAMERVGAAVAAQTLAVCPAHVHVLLTDRDGRLDVAILSPLRVTPLAHAPAESSARRAAGTSVMERCSTAELVIRSRFEELTGHTVGRLALQITGVEPDQQERVR